MSTKNLKITNEKNKALSHATDIFLGYAITFFVIIVYSVFLTYTNMTDKYIMFVVLITTIIATAYVGYQFARKANSRGLLWGILGGLLYGLIFVSLGFVSSETYEMSSRTIFVVVFSIVSGGMGGVIGINSKK